MASKNDHLKQKAPQTAKTIEGSPLPMSKTPPKK